MYQRSGGANRVGMCDQAEALEAGDTELFGKQALAVAGSKDPFFQTGFDPFRPGPGGAIGTPKTGWREKARLARQEEFARPQHLQFVAQFLLRIRGGKLRGAKLAGGKVQIGQAD